jgi:RimJ/RimL family protein N-acetyltransferase
MSVSIFHTPRLTLRPLTLADAPFILELLNDPDWLRYIGDRGVRTLDDARAYLHNGPIASYARNGFGLMRVELKDGATPIGMCGLIRRAELDDVDLGFAFLPAFRGQGYATEASAAVLAHGHDTLGLTRIVAITTQDNAGSMTVLRKLGFQFERLMSWPAEEAKLNLFAVELRSEGSSTLPSSDT